MKMVFFQPQNEVDKNFTINWIFRFAKKEKNKAKKAIRNIGKNLMKKVNSKKRNSNTELQALSRLSSLAQRTFKMLIFSTNY